MKLIGSISTCTYIFSDPVVDGIPVDGFNPVRNDQVNYLDLTNGGVKFGVDPNGEANKLWASIEQQIHEFNAKHHEFNVKAHTSGKLNEYCVAQSDLFGCNESDNEVAEY